ncbi:guanine deaminase [Mycolicibacterium goodii]|uniref:guanine deaminase n=1 Tax=Mycolicibacterium goodii TaxID=134601 RepID=UPI001F038F25|nr:guanine deaminase [Mycolicibacterium goodii]ULN48905.1 guanine deaminase [Mycolicibacterium goodii]
MTTYRGHLIHIAGAPRLSAAAQNLVNEPDGAIVVDDTGRITYSGPFDARPETGDEVIDRRPAFLLPGFVDTHIHFPQTYCTDSYGGGQLLDWLSRCIFPAEAKLADPAYAQRVAQHFCRRRISVGTTTALVFGSAFPHAQNALFGESIRTGLRTISGRGIQTVGPPSAKPLLTDEATAISSVADEIVRWHAADTGDPATALVHAAVVPRFALSVTAQTLHALGELYDSVRDSGVYFHTHLNESIDEVAAVRESYGVRNYLDTYDGMFGHGSAGKSLLGPRSVLAHAVHCTHDELARMADTGTSIAHCPTSQLFLGSGVMPWQATVRGGVNVALGTDVSAGDEWLIPRVLNDCFKVHMSEPGDQAVALHPAELLFTATLAGARALALEDRIGNLDAGKEADFVVVDPHRQELLAESLAQIDEDDRDALLFTLLMGMREETVIQVYVKGCELN